MKFCVFTLFVSFAVLINFTNGQYPPYARLLSNAYMPIVGLGTNSVIEEAEKVVTEALRIGYRHFDDASMYDNEKGVGRALRNWFARGGRRQDVFVTSKLPAFGNRPSDVERYLLKSLNDLGLSYVDMYLIHFPAAIKESREGFSAALNPDGSVIFDYDSDFVAVWKEMERQVKLGRARSIGLSNFNISQITKILQHAEIPPSNLQIEIHTLHQQREIREFCRRNGIAVTAYSPLASQSSRQYLRPDQDLKNFPNVLKDPVIRRIGQKYGKTNAQVVLRHLIQSGAIVIPRSSNPHRLRENINLFNFSLTREDMYVLDSFDMGKEGKIFDYKLVYKGIENHREYPFA